MKTDKVANPSILAVAFNRRGERWEKFKEEANKKGIVIREIIPVDIQIPVDERYNEAMNFLKQNTSPILQNYFNVEFPFRDTIFKAIEKKANLKPLTDIEEFEKSNYYPFGYLGLTPLMIDTKYLKNDWFTTDEEKENYKKMFSLKSEGYKPLKTPTKNEEDFKKLNEN